ncbi:hypothetical protein D918_01166 [Trichuris suis]|nr:hypothetical protein D918_01166 [Trichuris suis]
MKNESAQEAPQNKAHFLLESLCDQMVKKLLQHAESSNSAEQYLKHTTQIHPQHCTLLVTHSGLNGLRAVQLAVTAFSIGSGTVSAHFAMVKAFSISAATER